MQFDWDNAKRAKNLVKHGVDFADVSEAFTDPRRHVTVDARFDYGETRLNMLAKISGRVFHVTFTERGSVIWLISARKADRREQRHYDDI